MNWLKKITLPVVLVVFLGLLTAASLTSCGKQGSTDTETGQPAEEEHPQGESDEHPTEQEEHPAESDSTATDPDTDE